MLFYKMNFYSPERSAKARMKRFVRILVVLLLLLGMASQFAACSFLSDEARTQLENGRSEDVPGAEDVQEPEEPVVPDDLGVVISEVMASNKSCLALGNDFPDWVELYNGGESVSLHGLVLCCGEKSFPFPDREMAAGEYLLVYCDGLDAADDGELHASFAIPKEGAILSLRSVRDKVFDEFEYPESGSDRSAVRGGDGAVTLCDLPTPGFENSKAGYDALQETLSCASPLQISEAVVGNNSFKAPDGLRYDWVELQNVGDEPLELSDYYLSDSGKDRMAFRLPEQTLEGGGRVVVFCAGPGAAEGYAPFKLSVKGDQLFLTNASGDLADYMTLRGLPRLGSFGRMEGRSGFFYFASPTPGEANADGCRRVAEKPVLLTREGVYNDVESVAVSLSAPGEIHYTTDGSAPTEDSPVYTEPVVFTGTSVLRAIQIEEGCVTSPVLNTSFIINENHTLPVVSVMLEPEQMSDRQKMYKNIKKRLEVPGAVEFFDGDESFSITCGIKTHGATSRRISEKKSIKLCFRGTYEGNLEYDLFGNGVTEFGSILLRHPVEEMLSSMFRDIIVHRLAQKCFPNLPAQDYRPAVVYINGQYWGVYGIREAHSAEHFAQHYGYDSDEVIAWKKLWDRKTAVGKACEFALYNNLSKQENYDRVAKYLDVDSVIGWTILQAWCSNYDCNPSNVRYYYSTSDERLFFALSDLDLGMFNNDCFEIPLVGSANGAGGLRNNYDFNKLPRSLMSNRDYQLRMAEQLSAALHGPMSDEAVLKMIDELQAEIEPEMERELKRWFPGVAIATWHRKVDAVRTFVTRFGGRHKEMIRTFKVYSNLTNEEYAQFFGDLD